MKTITEFNGFALKAAIEKKKEILASGKTAEELPAALGEALKIEGDKLTWLLAAVELAEAKPENLKRIVVGSLAEGEKAPHGAVEKAEKVFLTEFFYTAQPKKQGRENNDQRGGGKGKDGKRGKKGGGRGGRPGGGPGGRGENKPKEAGAQNDRGGRRQPRQDGERKDGNPAQPKQRPTIVLKPPVPKPAQPESK
jgi:hypothetical protein